MAAMQIVVERGELDCQIRTSSLPGCGMQAAGDGVVPRQYCRAVLWSANWNKSWKAALHLGYHSLCVHIAVKPLSAICLPSRQLLITLAAQCMRRRPHRR
jgi:hypothetical protein